MSIIISEIAHLLWGLIKTDRVVQAGAGTSATSLWGSQHLASDSMSLATWAAQAQPWIALFSAVFGGLAALATFFYVCLKIRRLLKNPRATE